MQANGALQGGRTIPRRGRLQVVLAILAIVVIAAMVALLVWVVPLATSGVGAEDAIPKAGAGSAIVHDNAGNVHRNEGSGVMWAAPFASSGVGAEDAKPKAGAGSAVIHDDAGNVQP